MLATSPWKASAQGKKSEGTVPHEHDQGGNLGIGISEHRKVTQVDGLKTLT